MTKAQLERENAAQRDILAALRQENEALRDLFTAARDASQAGRTSDYIVGFIGTIADCEGLPLLRALAANLRKCDHVSKVAS